MGLYCLRNKVSIGDCGKKQNDVGFTNTKQNGRAEASVVIIWSLREDYLGDEELTRPSHDTKRRGADGPLCKERRFWCQGR